MMRTKQSTRSWIAAALLVSSTAWSGLNQFDLAAQEPPGDTPAVSLPDAAVSTDDLADLLKPLTKDELIEQVKGWQGRLKAQAEVVSQLAIAARAGGDGAPTAEAQQAARDERLRIADRMNVAIEALRVKGGEVEEFETYVSTVSSGLEIDAKDPNAVVTAVKAWALSDEGGIRWAKNIGLFVVTLIIFRVLAKIAGGIVRKALSVTKGNTSALLQDFLVNSVRKVVFFVGVIVALSMLEVNIGPFLAAMGAAGFIIGFALQDTLGNFAAGIMVLLYRPYDVGDVISAAGVTGKVDAMSLVSTTLKTPDNQTVVVPNGSIWGGIITNVTGNPTRRVDLVFGIGYDDDIGKAQAVLEEILANHPLILKDPAPVVQLHELADSSVNFVCRPWAKTGDYWAVYWDLTKAVKERFDKEKISIPYPQTDVHLHQS